MKTQYDIQRKLRESILPIRLNLILVAVFLLSACAVPIRNISEQELLDKKSGLVDAYKEEIDIIARKSRLRLAQEYVSDSQSFDILVLSGGGELGAFGAGFLKGWGSINTPEYKRPIFDSVSGISTGALIAPFAFAGTESSYDRIVELYRNPDEGMVILRAFTSILALKGSVYDAGILHKRIKENIREELINQLAQGADENRVLIVGATNLDYGSMHVWDLAQIAKNNDFETSHKLITERLIASSAIPAAFPPVNIDGFLYVDGGASMQVVSGIDNRAWLYNNEKVELDFLQADKPIKIRIWMIVNNKLVMDPEVVTPTWTNISTRSLRSLMRGSTLQTIQDTETFAQLINQREEFDVEMKYVSIPQDVKLPATNTFFDKEKMRLLVELGETMGKNPQSWKSRAIRPGAAILDISN